MLSHERRAIRFAGQNNIKHSHNPEVVGSNPPPATMKLQVGSIKAPDLFLCLGVSASLVLWVPRGGQSDRCLRVSWGLFTSRSCLVLARRSLWDVSLCHRLSGGGAQVVPRGVAPFDATLPGYSFHWCFFMSTQPLSRKATPSSVSSARWSGKFGARRPAWLTTRWQG